MELIEFRQEDHLHFIQAWLGVRKLPSQLAEELPDLGLIAFEKGQAIAAGFLRMIEGNMAAVDSVITDPEALPPLRHEALEAIIAALIKSAKHAGLIRLLAFSSDMTVFHRARRFGFKKAKDRILGLNLEGE